MSPRQQELQREFDALPEWAKKMVLALEDEAGWGFHQADHIVPLRKGEAEKYIGFHINIRSEAISQWSGGVGAMRELRDCQRAKKEKVE